ncbi:MAG: HNH endonuclease [Giesbergeria sp.]
MASQSGVLVPVQLDDEDAAALPGKVSVGSHGYAQVYEDGQVKLLHRRILGCSPGDRSVVDHINRNKLDNRRGNLRLVTPSESSANITSWAGSGYRGVYPNKKRWAAAAKKDGRKVHLGTYDTPEEAAHVAHEWRVANLPGYTG